MTKRTAQHSAQRLSWFRLGILALLFSLITDRNNFSSSFQNKITTTGRRRIDRTIVRQRHRCNQLRLGNQNENTFRNGVRENNEKNLIGGDSQKQQRQRNRLFRWDDFKRRFYNAYDGLATLLNDRQELYQATSYSKTDVRKGFVQNSYVNGKEDSKRPTKASARVANGMKSSSSLSSTPSTFASLPVRPEPIVSVQKQNRQKSSSQDQSERPPPTTETQSTNGLSSPSNIWQTRGRDESTNTVAISTLQITARPSMNRRGTWVQDTSGSDRQQQQQQPNVAVEEGTDRRRLEADMKIREDEAMKRAAIRGEVHVSPTRKTDATSNKSEAQSKNGTGTQFLMYAIKSSIELLPGAVENAVSLTMSFPSTVQDLPTKIDEGARATQKSIQVCLDTTQKFASDIQDIPNKMTRSMEKSQRNLRSAQESVAEAASYTKVLVGLEKPKPKPPKIDPPLDRAGKEIEMDVAGKVAGLAGKIAWWTSKQTAKIAWKGVQFAATKGIEKLTPIVEEVWDKTTASKISKQNLQPHPPTTPAPETSADEYTPRQKEFIEKINTEEDLDREIAKAQSLAEEVAAALELAEQALKVSESRGKDRTRQ